MPWKVKKPMELKMEFIKRLNEGERMSELCREYGIQRKTGYKLKQRFAASGEPGLAEESRAPKHRPLKTPPEMEKLLLAERRKRPTWGPRKLKDVLEKRLGHPVPAASTIGDLLKRAGLVETRRRRPKYRAVGTLLREAKAPNDVWCVDYKGQFRLGDRSYCYPLTMTDQYSRFLLGCEGMSKISDEAARETCEEIFRAHGLPKVMRSDNGVPFSSTGLLGLSKLSAYWLRLGIVLERIRPSHPEENGQHERMHRTLKRETTRPARMNLLQQQERFDAWVEDFNHQRPHEALGMKRPAEVYVPSMRPLPARLPDLEYPTHDDVLRVGPSGHVHLPRRGNLFVSSALAGQQIGLRELDDGRWLLSFASLDLGYVDANRRFSPVSSAPPEGH